MLMNMTYKQLAPNCTCNTISGYIIKKTLIIKDNFEGKGFVLSEENILHKDRLCTLCNKLEDEFHVICECPRYDTCRKLYIKPYYVRKPRMAKLIQLLNTDNIGEMQKLAIFIKMFLIFIRTLYLTSCFLTLLLTRQ